jgi:hypothetical protein
MGRGAGGLVKSEGLPCLVIAKRAAPWQSSSFCPARSAAVFSTFRFLPPFFKESGFALSGEAVR